MDLPFNIMSISEQWALEVLHQFASILSITSSVPGSCILKSNWCKSRHLSLFEGIIADTQQECKWFLQKDKD